MTDQDSSIQGPFSLLRDHMVLCYNNGSTAAELALQVIKEVTEQVRTPTLAEWSNLEELSDQADIENASTAQGGDLIVNMAKVQI